MKRIDVPQDCRDFAKVFAKSGFLCYFVGGAVRDSLMGREVSDWDAATDASSADVVKLFRSVIPTGIQHGTVTVRWRGRSIETTTFRIDGEYRDGRRPESVQFTADLFEDLSRRDFSINGMAADPATGDVIDTVGGRADLAAGIIRAIGDPLTRFTEDGLRPLRAVRFASRLGFRIEEATLHAIGKTLDRFKLVSAERIRDEFSKILMVTDPRYGLNLLEQTGLLGMFLPELSDCKGVMQGGPHLLDVFGHLVESCSAAPADQTLRLAALLHDIGKPLRRVEGQRGDLAFHGHDTLSAAMAETALKRLKFTNATIEAVTHLVGNHMFDYSADWTDAAVRRFVAKVGIGNMHALVMLRLADSSGMGYGPADPRTVMPLLERVENLRAKDQAFCIKDLAIDGNDLAGIGWPRGPAMGKVLAELLEAVLDDPELNTQPRLLEISRNLKSRYGV
jgi:tRNA nucleotidyltransferase (CCA-adding enzyme)